MLCRRGERLEATGRTTYGRGGRRHVLARRRRRRELTRLAPPGSRIKLRRDPRLDSVDIYGRLLRYVQIKGMIVNVELVRRGAATPYLFDGDRGNHA